MESQEPKLESKSQSSDEMLSDEKINSLSKISKKSLAVAAVIVILAFFGFIFGTSAIRLFIGLALVYILPLYFILDYFKLEQIEKIFLALFSAFGIIPMSTYYLSKIFGSLRIGLIVAFVVLVAIAAFLNRDKLKEQYNIYKNKKSLLSIKHEDKTQNPEK